MNSRLSLEFQMKQSIMPSMNDHCYLCLSLVCRRCIQERKEIAKNNLYCDICRVKKENHVAARTESISLRSTTIDATMCAIFSLCTLRFLFAKFSVTIQTKLIAFIAPIIGYYFIFERIILWCFW